MTRTRLSIVHGLVLLAALSLFGCGGGGSTTGSGSPDSPQGSLLVKPEHAKAGSMYSDPVVDFTWDLIAGQTTDVGYIKVTNDDANFYVEYFIDVDGWLIHQVHAYVGQTAPPSNGAPGQFTYVDDDIDPGVEYYKATIPFSDVFGAGQPAKGLLYAAAHAVVCTAGEQGQPYGGYSIQGGAVTATMWAGQNTQSGAVTVSVVGDNLVVIYNTTGGWKMTQTQLYVGTSVPGNAPGQYPYKTTHNPAVTTFTYTIPLTSFNFWGGNGSLYIAAHADTKLYDQNGNEIQSETSWAWPTNGGVQFDQGWGRYFSINLVWDWFAGDPTAGYCETAWGGTNGTKIKGKYQWTDKWSKKWGGYFKTFWMPVFAHTDWRTYSAAHFGPQAYWGISFTDNTYPFPGGNVWNGWCVDLPHSMYPGNPYEVQLWSCYDPNLPAFAQSGNWDLISYILTKRNAGGGIYGADWTNNANKEQFQTAVWYFMGGGGAPAGGSLADQVVQDALANGEGFIPGSGQYYAVILYPHTDTDNNTVRAQMNIIEVDP